MKKLLLILLCGSFFFLSCKDDTDGSAEFRYDADNFSAPVLPAGTFVAGARFPRNIVDNYLGRNLVEVEFYIQDKPIDCRVIIYGEGSGTSPGNVLYSKNVFNEISANSWHSHSLDTPIEITNQDLWLAIEVVHNADLRSIGCDPGPARTNGDWMLGEGETEWKTYRDLSNQQVNVNWNIRGYLDQD